MIIGLFDRIIFALGVLIFLQLPAFVDQYTHRLGGYQRAQQVQIADLQKIADRNYDGDMLRLIADFSNSNTGSVRETAYSIQASLNNAEDIQSELSVLEKEGLTKQLLFLATNLRYELANDTVKQFDPSFPLNIQSFLYGLLGGIIASLLFNTCIRLPVRWADKKRQLKKKNDKQIIV